MMFGSGLIWNQALQLPLHPCGLDPGHRYHMHFNVHSTRAQPGPQPSVQAPAQWFRFTFSAQPVLLFPCILAMLEVGRSKSSLVACEKRGVGQNRAATKPLQSVWGRIEAVGEERADPQSQGHGDTCLGRAETPFSTIDARAAAAFRCCRSLDRPHTVLILYPCLNPSRCLSMWHISSTVPKGTVAASAHCRSITCAQVSACTPLHDLAVGLALLTLPFWCLLAAVWLSDLLWFWPAAVKSIARKVRLVGPGNPFRLRFISF